ncbi:MAG: hypothetical protein ACYTHJ_01745 [Planctomycetota bacterium]|jgi:hypothetical protein
MTFEDVVAILIALVALWFVASRVRRMLHGRGSCCGLGDSAPTCGHGVERARINRVAIVQLGSGDDSHPRRDR